MTLLLIFACTARVVDDPKLKLTRGREYKIEKPWRK